MAFLPHARLQAVHAAAIELQLDRATLLAGVSPAYAASLPTAPNPMAQHYQDLHRMNTTGPLVDESIPLRAWLEAALLLASARPEKRVFEEALALMEGESRTSIAEGVHRGGARPAPDRRDETRAVAPAEASLYVSFVARDAAIVERLQVHLGSWWRTSGARLWHPGLAAAGRDLGLESEEHLRGADVVLLIVSAEYLASTEAREEVRIAMEGHHLRRTRVIPILARPCDAKDAPFSSLQMLPYRDRRPLAQHPRADEAYAEISKALRSVIDDVKRGRARIGQASPTPPLHWLDVVPFPYHLPQANHARKLLVEAYWSITMIRILAARAGIYLGHWDDQHGVEPAWESLLGLAAAQGKLRALIEAVLGDANVGGYHAALRKACETG